MNFKIKFLLPVFAIVFAIGCYDTQSAANNVKSPPTNETLTKTENLPSPKSEEKVSPTPPMEKKSDKSTDTNLQSLKRWVGEYPVGENKQKQSFFELPEVKPTLIKILGEKGYKDFLDGFELVEPIESLEKTDTIGGKKVDSDYLILQGAYNGKSISNKSAPENTLFVIELNSKEFYILTVKDGKLTERGNVDEFVLPEEIEKKITVYPPEN